MLDYDNHIRYYLLYELSYTELYMATLLYFLLLYFFLAPLFLSGCKFLHRKKILKKIVDESVSRKQTLNEMKQSLIAISVFGFSSIPVFYLLRRGQLDLLPGNWWNIMLGLLILTVWNEVHFFIVHRLMHFPLFMRHVHFVHHRSRIPTVYSVYSFHWFEALLLSTVPFCIVPFVPFSSLAIFLFPLLSILLNYAGHCNYRFGNGGVKRWLRFGTEHHAHHYQMKNNFGFATPFLDQCRAKFKR
jgi:lathosterol oxidase